jgi:hypothetical protein
MSELEAWLAEAGAKLGVDPAVLARCTDPLLDLVRDVAHGVSRPGAPLTAFLVGLAAGAAGGDPSEQVLDRVAQVSALVEARRATD